MLHVWKASGEELVALHIEGLGEVKAVKQYLEKLCGLPRFRQELLHEGCNLDDSAFLRMQADVQLVLLSFSDASQEQVDELASMAGAGFQTEVEKILKRPQDPDLLASDGTTALYQASLHGRADVVRLLLEAGADKELGRKDAESARTPLRVACERGHTEVLRLLLQARANWNATDEHGRSPLWVACRECHTEAACLLLEARADTQALTQGEPLLCLVSQRGLPEVARLLLQARSDVNTNDKCWPDAFLDGLLEGIYGCGGDAAGSQSRGCCSGCPGAHASPASMPRGTLGFGVPSFNTFFLKGTLMK